MVKPTQKQARGILIKKLIEEIQDKEQNLSNQKLMLNMLMSGNLDKQIEITDYKNRDWHFNLRVKDLDVSIYEFVDKKRKVEKTVERF